MVRFADEPVGNEERARVMQWGGSGVMKQEVDGVAQCLRLDQARVWSGARAFVKRPLCQWSTRADCSLGGPGARWLD